MGRNRFVRLLALVSDGLLWAVVGLILSLATLGAVLGRSLYPALQVFGAGAVDLLPVTVLGCGLLILASLLARSHRATIFLGFCIAAISLYGALVSDATVPPDVWHWGRTLFLVHWAGVGVVAALGWSLIRAPLWAGRAQSEVARAEQAPQPDSALGDVDSATK